MIEISQKYASVDLHRTPDGLWHCHRPSIDGYRVWTGETVYVNASCVELNILSKDPFMFKSPQLSRFASLKNVTISQEASNLCVLYIECFPDDCVKHWNTLSKWGAASMGQYVEGRQYKYIKFVTLENMLEFKRACLKRGDTT
jgi:hypothetical protein